VEHESGGGNETFMLNLNIETPLIIRGEEGFEKRWPLRCKRCKLVVGYQLDTSRFPQTETTTSGREEDVIYLLPGAVVPTEEMKEGKMPSEEI